MKDHLWWRCTFIRRCQALASLVQMWSDIGRNCFYSGTLHSVIDNNTVHKVEVATLEDRRMTIQQIIQDVKLNVELMDKNIHANCAFGSCPHERFLKFSHLFRSRNESISSSFFWQSAKKSRTFSVDLSHRMKHGSITITLRVRSCRSNGGMITHNPQKRLASNSQQASCYSQSLGPAWSSDGGLSGKGHHN